MTSTMKNLINADCKKSCTDVDDLLELKNQSIYVTGGTGFMGKWIAEMVAFINTTAGFNIQLFLSGRDIQRFKREMPHLAEQPFIHLVEQDVRNIHDLPASIGYIIHAAGTPDNREHVSQPVRVMETFSKGTQSLLEAATRLDKLKKIIYISSHQVYGHNETGAVVNEKYLGKLEPNGINSVYPESKRFGETLCSIYRSQFRLPLFIIRPFAFIGPYQDLEKPWAINNFIRDGILGGPIRILGNKETVRTYLYASDMAYWLLKGLVRGEAGGIYNLGSKEAISLVELAAKIKNAIQPGIEVLSKSSKENYTHISKWVPDTAKITRSFKVAESFTLDEAINRTIVWNQLKKGE